MFGHDPRRRSPLVADDQTFDLTVRVALITGGGGMLGGNHAETVAGAGGIPVLLDFRLPAVQSKARELTERFGVQVGAIESSARLAGTEPRNLVDERSA